MMMPANFSAISENEMTYVNGGASLSEILAPELKLENWQKFNQNMVTIIGNSFLGDYVSNTVGSRLWAAYKPATWARPGSALSASTTIAATMPLSVTAPDAGMTYGNTALGTLNGALNAGLRLAGSAAAIYNLATANVKNGLPSLFDFREEGDRLP